MLRGSSIRTSRRPKGSSQEHSFISRGLQVRRPGAAAPPSPLSPEATQKSSLSSHASSRIGEGCMKAHWRCSEHAFCSLRYSDSIQICGRWRGCSSPNGSLQQQRRRGCPHVTSLARSQSFSSNCQSFDCIFRAIRGKENEH